MYNFEEFMKEVERKNPGQPEFIQACREVVGSVIDTVNSTPKYLENKILDRIVEPDKIHEFKVVWEDDNHQIQVNRGYRIQYNRAIGPYKGGLRFAKNVTLGTLKFLGFEQIFKNSLTTLPMGGAKGGSDFDPIGKSDREVMRFCQAFMNELQKYIGPYEDVPAGDVGVGGREIGYLYGQWLKLRDENSGVLTCKGLTYGGSLVRPEATGFGALYFTEQLMKQCHDTLKGKRVIVSGYGNVSWGTVIKATELGAKVVGISSSKGYVLDESGINTKEKFDYMLEMRNGNQGLASYPDRFPGAKYFAGRRIWEVPCDIAFTGAIQNELNGDDAKTLLKNGCKYVLEVSNMGCTQEAVDTFQAAKIPFCPGKAVNAGGVATSGLEMVQNGMHYSWSAEKVDEELKNIMTNIFESCVREGKEADGYINYVKGANIAGFKKVADAMCEEGF